VHLEVSCFLLLSQSVSFLFLIFLSLTHSKKAPGFNTLEYVFKFDGAKDLDALFGDELSNGLKKIHFILVDTLTLLPFVVEIFSCFYDYLLLLIVVLLLLLQLLSNSHKFVSNAILIYSQRKYYHLCIVMKSWLIFSLVTKFNCYKMLLKYYLFTRAELKILLLTILYFPL